MSMIKSVKDLPDWFKTSSYRKNLDGVDWYREVRKREWAAWEIRLASKDPTVPAHRALTLFRASYKELKKNWSLYYQYGLDDPVRDMSRAHAMFLAAYNYENEECQLFFDSAKVLIDHYKGEIRRGSEWAPPEYEDRLSFFMDDWINYENVGMDEMAYKVTYENGNPFLEYGRPFEGFPVIIDATFDDETIIRALKVWLKGVRENNSPAKRPFNQNDYDDWTFYKIREVHDLDAWSRLASVKIPDRVIASALWPHASDDMSPIDILRTTSRKKVREIFTADVSQRLYGQMSVEKGVNFLEE